MYARTAALFFAGFVCALLAISNVESEGLPAQHTWTPLFSAVTADEQPQDPLQQLDAARLRKLIIPSGIHYSSSTGPFGRSTTMSSSGRFVTMWEIMQDRIRADREVLKHCRVSSEPCPATAQTLLTIVAEGGEHTGRARIGIINRAINLTIRAAGVDYWTAPLETLAMARGDCKQYAILKYVALIEAGISEKDVKLVVLREFAESTNHAVVAAHLNGSWIILDNRSSTLVQDTEMRGVTPLFMFDQEGASEFGA